jgi:hypothetical protein
MMSQDTTGAAPAAQPVSGLTTDPANLPAPAPVVDVTPPAPVVDVTPPAPVVLLLTVGTLVSYRHRDTTTGTDLTGAGVVVRAADTGSVRVAPLSIYTIDALPELVAPLDAALLDVLA